jgi:hypothetical protein
MPGIMWYFVIALIVILAVMLAVPGEGAEIARAAGPER